MRQTLSVAGMFLSISVCGWLGAGIGERVEANAATKATSGRGAAARPSKSAESTSLLPAPLAIELAVAT
jgi:hypothetical protein